MKATIRTAKKSDAGEILCLLYELERPRPKNKLEKTRFRKRVLQYLSDWDKKILVAETDCKIVGLVSIVLTMRLNRTKLEMYVPELVVAKGHRRSGVGKMLIDSCIRIAKKKGCFRIRLESGNQRSQAHKFYKKTGFEQPAKTYVMNL